MACVPLLSTSQEGRHAYLVTQPGGTHFCETHSQKNTEEPHRQNVRMRVMLASGVLASAMPASGMPREFPGCSLSFDSRDFQHPSLRSLRFCNQVSGLSMKTKQRPFPNFQRKTCIHLYYTDPFQMFPLNFPKS